MARPWIYDAASAGYVLIDKEHVYGAYEGNLAAWRQVGVHWVSEWVNTAPGVFDQHWRQVYDFRPPTVVVPGVSISQTGPVSPPQATVTWSVIVNTGDPRYYYSVGIEWWVNGVLEHESGVPQSAGSVDRTFNHFDQVYARVNYYNSNGAGPVTQTPTLNL